MALYAFSRYLGPRSPGVLRYVIIAATFALARAKAAGYLNFSSGATDPQFLAGLSELWREIEVEGPSETTPAHRPDRPTRQAGRATAHEPRLFATRAGAAAA